MRMLSPGADLSAWLTASSSDEWARNAAAHASSTHITAAQLLAVKSEAEAAALLGVAKFGPKRKLWLLLKPSVDAATAEIPMDTTARSHPFGANTSAGAHPSSLRPSTAGPSGDANHASASAPIRGNAAAGTGNPCGRTSSPAPDDELADEAFALGNIQWVGDKLNRLLSQPEHAAWARPHVARAKLDELSTMRRQVGLPNVHIVVCGNTGAGKSTLLNALLSESSVLPTNGMRACTACLIEMAFDEREGSDEPRYRGEVEFLTVAEWHKELDDLLDDLTANDGPNAGRVSLSVNEDAPSYGSWCKLWAVYGESFTHSHERTEEFGPGNRRIYKLPTLASLKAKLHATRNITSALSTTRTVSADMPLAFKRALERFMDSTNEVVGGCHWPIVKRVRMYSRHWAALKTGAVLVDAPGVHDDNSARDAVVKTHLKNADAVWIVSNIVRAVNDKTAKDMLGEQFRRQLLMDGHFGSLAFIATHSDVLQRNEAIRSLHLNKAATLRDCALARNDYTARRLRSDFVAGLRELAEQAGDALSERDVASRGALPVFTVSAVDYQKLSGLRPHDGPPAVWEDAEGTQIPSLVRHVQRAALERRKVLSLRRCEAMRLYGESLVSILDHEHSQPQATRDAAKRAFDASCAEVRSRLRDATKGAEARIKAAFDDHVTPQLQAGASDAASNALSKAEEWGIPVTQGGLHWATYKATTRRQGVFRINMNQELVNPVFKSVSTHWERAFVTGLSTTLDALQSQVQAELVPFHDNLLAALSAAGVPSAASSGVQGLRSDGLLTSLRAAVDEIKEAAQKQQRDLSREMEPVVTKHMTPGYSAAAAEAGTGSHRRRVALLEAHVRTASAEMFKEAVGGVVDKLDKLRATIGQKLETEVTDGTLRTLGTTYTPLWDEVGEDAREVRRNLAPRVREILLEATTAVRRLNGSATGGAPTAVAAGEADDAEIEDVTAAAQALKRARKQPAIDLEDEEALENDCPQDGGDGHGIPPQQRRKTASIPKSCGGASSSADVFVAKGS
mmetsp:Transcript_23449/g.59853  ORF Transcript_23449/g.59853 Transcript_23449/m.59853 type:complete len:1022 (+) Transcript_23449:36-3101(+)